MHTSYRPPRRQRKRRTLATAIKLATSAAIVTGLAIWLVYW